MAKITKEEIMALPEWPSTTEVQKTDEFLGECEVVTDKIYWHGHHFEAYLRPSTGQRFRLVAGYF